ncbi:serine hydrolase [Chloroflexi bacterium TSY]|nr:serine hydrolase [Chloroflexi bacterium TSY]
MKKSFRNNLQHVIDVFQLPGIAVVVVQEGEVVFSEGFGYANLEERQPFTDEIVCLVASVTKSFTAGLTGCLVDRGVVEWTRPICEYIPNFKMIDEFATKKITLEDMLCHRSGLPWHENLLAYGVGRELSDSGRAFRADLLKRMAYFDPSSAFRTNFQYQDIVYTCAGAVLEHVTDQEYEVLVKQYLLDPLRMKVSTFERAEARKSGKLAQGYALIEGNIERIPFCDTRYFAPSAGLYSTAKDMTQWLKLQLSRGRFENKQILSEESLEWIQRPHMLENRASGLDAGVTTYGQGWRQNNIRGHLIVTHGGSFNGYRTFVGFVPEKAAGAIVLTNLHWTEGSSAAGMIVLDQLLDTGDVDGRIAFFQKRTQLFRELEKEEARKFEEGRDLQNPPSYGLEDYQGYYVHPGYGDFTVALEQDTLYQTYDGRTYPLVPYNGDTFASSFQSTENRLLDITFTFESDEQGHVVAVCVPLIPDIPTPRFVKEK